MQGFDKAKGNRGKSLRMSDVADMVSWPERDYGQFRLIGPVYCILSYWFTIITERKPEGVSIPKQCLDHDGALDEYVTDICPFRASGLGRESREYFVNAISREEQEGREWRTLNISPEEHLGFKARWVKIGDSRKTPVRLLGIPDSQIDKLQGMKKLNKIKDPETGEIKYMDISHPKYGCDIGLLFDGNKKGPARYDIQKGDRMPLTREERGYGLYRPDLLKPMRLEEAKREMEDLASKIKPKDAKKGGGKGRGRPEADDPLIDDDTVSMNGDDLEGGRRRKKRDADYDEDYESDRPRGRKSRGDDDDLDPDLDDDFSDDRPSNKRRSRDDDYEDDRPTRSARRSRIDNEDDDRGSRNRRSRDDEDEEDEEERLPRRRRSRDDD